MDYIASSTTWTAGVGAPECPWRLTARPGERIRLYLTDFSVEEPGSTLPPTDKCRTYGYIKETVGNIKGNPEHLSSTICGTDQRESHVYSSESNQVDLIFIDGSFQRPFFLIKFEGRSALSYMLFDQGGVDGAWQDEFSNWNVYVALGMLCIFGYIIIAQGYLAFLVLEAMISFEVRLCYTPLPDKGHYSRDVNIVTQNWEYAMMPCFLICTVFTNVGPEVKWKWAYLKTCYC